MRVKTDIGIIAHPSRSYHYKTENKSSRTEDRPSNESWRYSHNTFQFHLPCQIEHILVYILWGNPWETLTIILIYRDTYSFGSDSPARYGPKHIRAGKN